jgi:hypothetical protein
MSEPSSLIVIVMNDSLAVIAVRIFLLDQGRAVMGSRSLMTVVRSRSRS